MRDLARLVDAVASKVSERGRVGEIIDRHHLEVGTSLGDGP
jgi:hypothetical protein